MRKTLHIFLEPCDKHEMYWSECWYDADFVEYDVNLIHGNEIPHESALFADVYYKASQLKMLMAALERGNIKNGDVCIFVNAWNFAAIQLSHFIREFGLKVKLIGIWNDIEYNKQPSKHRQFKNLPKKTVQDFAVALLATYDRNCFFTDAQRKKYIKTYAITRKTALVDSMRVTGYPFEYLVKTAKPNAEKSNIIIIPKLIYDDEQARIVGTLANEIPSFKFVNVAKLLPERLKYRNFLKSAKVIFCSLSTENTLTLFWEAMLNGVIPLMPDNHKFEHPFPKKYYYPTDLVKTKNNKHFRVMRNRIQLHDTVELYTDCYNDLKVGLAEETAKITDLHYRNAPFLAILKETK